MHNKPRKREMVRTRLVIIEGGERKSQVYNFKINLPLFSEVPIAADALDKGCAYGSKSVSVDSEGGGVGWWIISFTHDKSKIQIKIVTYAFQHSVLLNGLSSPSSSTSIASGEPSSVLALGCCGKYISRRFKSTIT